MRIGIGTTNPQFALQAVQDNKEILRITEDGEAIPGKGLTIQEAVMAMCKMIRREGRERCVKVIRAECGPCAGSGHEDLDSEDECQYCGLPIQAIRKDVNE